MKDNGRLNIAILGHKRIPGREGGIEVVVEELASRMAASGCDVTCYNRGGNHVSGIKFDTAGISEYKGVHLRSVPTINRRGLAAMTASISGAFRAAFGRFDIVHFHAEGPSFMCWLPKLTGKKIIVTIHGLDHQRAKWGKLASTYIMLGEKSAVLFADEIIVLSRSAQQYFKENYKRDTILIPNGVNRPQIREADLIRERLGLEKDSYILYLGRIVPEKGIQYLIQAFKEVRTDKKLVIAGASSDSDAFLECLKKLAADDNRILFTGFVHGRMLEELYSNSYIYCLPSDLEGMPLSLLEAMSYGNCCVVSDIPECADVVGDKAVIFPKGNTGELAAVLRELCSAPELVQSYRTNSADYICGKYDWDKVTKCTLDLYQGRLSYADPVYQQISLPQRWQ